MPDVSDSLSVPQFFETADRVVGGSAKRAFDVALAAVALLLLAPALYIIAVVIWSANGGPVLYRHPRIGKSGRKFYCLKFRTMAPNADEILKAYLESNPASADEWRATQKLKRDPRVTRLGQLLRRTSLDELPQLVNILRGEMSFVGPRPIVEQEVAKYGQSIRDYVQARPGLTGLWQVSGRNDVSYDIRVTLDTRYVQNWSFHTDLIIIVKTIPAVLASRGCY